MKNERGTSVLEHEPTFDIVDQATQVVDLYDPLFGKDLDMAMLDIYKEPLDIAPPINEGPVKKDQLSFREWKKIQDLKEQEGEKRERHYGAFVQILVKDGDRIQYISRGLPVGTTPEMLTKMTQDILHPEGSDQKPETYGGDNRLQILAKPGRNIGAVHRFLQASATVVENDHPDSEHASVKKFNNDNILAQQEFPEIKRRFLNGLFAVDAQPEVADGVHVHGGAYKFRDGTAIGLDITGENEFDLLKLAADGGHQEQMEGLVDIFNNYETVTAVLVDCTESVGKCDEACEAYYAWKEEVSDYQVDHSSAAQSSYSGGGFADHIIGPGVFQETYSEKNCDKCAEKMSSCKCWVYINNSSKKAA